MEIRLQNDFSKDTTAQEIFTTLLKSKGFKTKKEIEVFLKPPRPDLDYLLANLSIKGSILSRAKKIVSQSLAKGQDILVFGDYDADGITSTAILWQTLMYLGKKTKARILPFIPDRTRHGYGLSDRAINDIESGLAFQNTSFTDFKPQLIITVDNGIVAVDEVKRLQKLGVQVIITDHHQPGDRLPSADAIIHSTGTSGAGISWLFSLYLAGSADYVSDMIDLCTIGVVADQMPLLGVNRSIVTHGLRRLSQSSNLGLQAMKEVSGIAEKPVTTYDINFRLAPRINAVGRIDNPLEALRLLCTQNRKFARRVASSMEEHNTKRQALTDQAVKKALETKPRHKLVIASSPDFHEGVIGLVAGKLVEAHTRPAIAISIGEEISKGSARSLPGINITDILRSQKDLLLSVGGHEQAGGFSIKTSDIPKFQKLLYRYADSHIDSKSLQKSLSAEGELKLSQTSMTLAKLIHTLEPFGMGNYKPRFLVQDFQVLEDRKIGKNNNHRKLVIEKDSITRDVIWFNGDAHHPLSRVAQMIFTIEVNIWRNKEYLQLNAQYVEANK